MFRVSSLANQSTLQPPITRGLLAWFDTSSYDVTNKIWRDKSGNNRNATTVTGTPNIKTSSGAAGGEFETVYGGTGDRIQFPNSVIGSTFTIVGVTRYDGATKQRILTNLAGPGTWLSGHHVNKGGVYYPTNGNATPFTDIHGSNWVINVAKNSPDKYWHNGTNRAVANPALSATAPTSFGINIKTDELSMWACCEIICYNVALTDSEVDDINRYLGAKYSIRVTV